MLRLTAEELLRGITSMTGYSLKRIIQSAGFTAITIIAFIVFVIMLKKIKKSRKANKENTVNMVMIAFLSFSVFIAGMVFAFFLSPGTLILIFCVVALGLCIG